MSAGSKELGLVSCQQPPYRYKRGGPEHIAIPNHPERQREADARSLLLTPSADEKIARIVPLLDAAYVDQLRRYLATFRTGRRRPLFAVSRKTAWLWMQQVIDRAREEGIEFALPAINPKTLRHSFAMHLFFNHVPPKVGQAYMGHERYESTEVYLKVFALDVAPQLGVTFSLDHRDYSHLLTRK